MTTLHMNSALTSSRHAGTEGQLAYGTKRGAYFTGARRTFLDLLPANPQARLLELGCGSGNTAAAALAEGKCGWACGIELCEAPAAQARAKLNQVIVGDIERLSLDLPP